MSLWRLRTCRGDQDPSVLADSGREKTSSTSMLSPPPPLVGGGLLYPSAPHRGTPDGCGRVRLGKEESSSTGRACRSGCPSGNFPSTRNGLVGLGAPAMR